MTQFFLTYGEVSALISVLAVIVSAIAIVISAYQFNKAQEQTSRPYIGANIISEVYGPYLYLYIKNYGKESAKIVGLAIKEEIKLINCDKNNFFNGILLMPNQAVSIGIDFSGDDNGRDRIKNTNYTLTLDYVNAANNKKPKSYHDECIISAKYLDSQCHSEFLTGTKDEKEGETKYLQLIYHSIENANRRF
ncbi:MAG: hypothetical protein ACOH15_04865 [Acetobacterium sp.]